MVINIKHLHDDVVQCSGRALNDIEGSNSSNGCRQHTWGRKFFISWTVTWCGVVVTTDGEVLGPERSNVKAS
jgi:hypothetical protein